MHTYSLSSTFAASKNSFMINRDIISLLHSDLDSGKILVVLGPRQTGKTTVLNMLAESAADVYRLNCDDYDDAVMLTHRTSTELKQLAEGHRWLMIDEAQRVEDIGMTLKILADLHLPVQIVVTGSSSLELANKISEPATGRIFEYTLFPLSVHELVNHTDKRQEQRLLNNRLVYGFYPEVVTHPADAKRILMQIANSYLYKDLLGYQGIKRPELLQKLVRALALQMGSEVSFNELSNLLGADKGTIEAYIRLLEQCFVVFRLESLSRNMRNEIKRGKKIYFYDNGIRNALINNFAPPELRTDTGALWENMMISERIKRNARLRRYAFMYFWRTVGQQEIDLIEEEDGTLASFEFKWNANKKAKQPLAFAKSYPDTPFQCVTPANYMDFVE